MASGGKASKVTVEVAGRSLTLSNLDKVLYPEAGFTKGEVIDYYAAVAETLLPHLEDRPLTRKRWPDGTGSGSFFEKNKPRGTPDWVRTTFMPEHGDDGVDYVVAESLATLVWLANLAALELHVPQWRVDDAGEPLPADLLVIDLDPGPPADIIDCCNVALAMRQLLEADGLAAFPKTSGNKGAQLYVPVEPTSSQRTSAYAKQLADQLAAALPDLVLSTMDRAARKGKVFVDWSQNNAAKTTVAPYSLRGIERPTVSTPLTWEEVAEATEAADLRFEAADVVRRIDELGDLLADMPSSTAPLP
ncbi:MAG: ATP-dependent DNA ligase [Nocardioidaceae bacterium]|nr:ATP-dependent DNA ligase [Nocardioidaceae bacterium]